MPYMYNVICVLSFILTEVALFLLIVRLCIIYVDLSMYLSSYMYYNLHSSQDMHHFSYDL